MNAPPPRFLDDRLAHWAAATPQASAVTYADRTWSFAEHDARVRRLAGALAAAGVERGDVVAFLDKNHLACAELTMAAATLGVANAVINWRLAGDEIDFAINDCGATLLVVGTELRAAVEELRDRLPRVERILEVTPEGGEGEYEAFLAAGEPQGRRAEVTPDDPCLILYSSGTTGRPKGIVLTHANLVAHTVNNHAWEREEDDVHVVAMPFFHVAGSAYMLTPLHDGVRGIITREADGPSIFGAIMQGGNRMFLVPAVLAQVMQAGEQAVALFGQIKSFSYGASPMPPPLLRAAMKTWPDLELIQVYGLTEVSGAVTVLLPEEHRQAEAEGHPERLLSAGRPLPGTQVRIVDPGTLQDVAVGEPGEIWLRTAQLMQGYHGRPEATAEAVDAEGWFRSGDLGKVDADGFVYVEDRIKDMIISGGENVYSPEVERVLAEHPAVLECAAIGVPHEKWGETVRAVVALKPSASATADDIIGFCRDRLAHYKCPTEVVFLDALPRNPSGKILKRELRPR